MEILQVVRVRRERWHVADSRAFESCRLLTLTSAEPRRRGITRRVLAPFDDIDVVRPRQRPLTVTWRRARRACRALIGDDGPPDALRTPRRAAIDLLPHQLEPALAIVRGLGARVLLADDVGLGKTIQAGLIVAELIARAAVDRVLVMAPAGVRDQWASELSRRFNIDAVVADARSLREAAAHLPLGTNPWTTLPIAIASLDYVKRPEVLPAVQSVRWDVVIVDEAHCAAGQSERQAAIQAIARRAPYVLLLTATPHSGDQPAFEALCRIGATGGVDDPLLVFRRTREAIRGDAVRRTHILRVRTTAVERRMHAALDVYRRAVHAEHGDRSLALSVLDKRGYSSAWSLMQSVSRRIEVLAEPVRTDPIDPTEHVQLALPLGDPDGEHLAEDEVPMWPASLELADTTKERRLLGDLLAFARAAVRYGESKVRVLQKLLRRAREPMLIFTEYRDTALHLQSTLARTAGTLGGVHVLHGGLTRDERTDVLRRFAGGDVGVLISTDAAGQGLNLQYSARIVVNLELPWNPMRLEQRIGRLDRIGQKRRVHAFHLVGASTGESGMLARLGKRIGVARASIDAPDPLDLPAQVNACPSTPEAPQLVRPALGPDAVAETTRLSAARAYEASDSDLIALHAAKPWAVRARRARIRAALLGRTLFLFQLRCEDDTGALVATRLATLAGRVPTGERPTVPDDVVAAWKRDVDVANRSFWSARLQRERAIADDFDERRRAPYQTTLFDRRADRERSVERASEEQLRRLARERLFLIERRSILLHVIADLLLIVQP